MQTALCAWLRKGCSFKDACAMEEISYETFRMWQSEKSGPKEKHALARFLFSNIKIGDGKVLELAYNSIIRDLFVSDGGAEAPSIR